MILTTTNTIEGHKVQDYLGIVTGVSIKVKKGGMTFSMEKYADSFEALLSEIKEEAFQELRKNAINLKANAIVGIKIDIEPLTSFSMIMVSITGTAVKVV
ncbi:MAG: heavy metal-binding domain-containing protein [Flavobacteriaceae bacterium]|jgi:uncharacterized protein YbjQ (UPF0145 family)|nr:heavy metal-binding domain-containing protein [Flavobacteriaceae bacterium]